MFKAGDRVECIARGGNVYIEVGKVYSVQSAHMAGARQYIYIDDLAFRYSSALFKLADDPEEVKYLKQKVLALASELDSMNIRYSRMGKMFDHIHPGTISWRDYYNMSDEERERFNHE